MLHPKYYSLRILFLATTVISQKCQLQFDARVPANARVADFDVKTSLFSTDNVIGEGLKFSQVIQLPTVQPALFDVKNTAFEVTISDKSIFNKQVGFRRCELLPESVTGDDPSTEKIKTIHFSVQADPARSLNTKHEYQLAFMEDNDFTTNQWVLKTGTILGHEKQDPNDLVLMGNVKDDKILFTTPFTPGVFHNFALKLNFDDNKIAVFYSKAKDPLQNVLTETSNDLTGRGQYHFGILKKPTGTSKDITKEGTQPSKINEGIIFGSVFMEDSLDGCMSTAP
ncbi:hypothetical protein K3495_g7856 [Podosphaera aphanis]|nr:hypothetical protein K3495_g7856 [Podosphaera aphanis]